MNNDNKENEKLFVMCDCHSHALFLEIDEYEKNKNLNISLFERGTNNKKFSLSERIRWCLHLLKTGKPFTDMVILNDKKAIELKKFLNDHF